MTGHPARVQVSLRPDGVMVIELPGVDETTRSIPTSQASIGPTLARILAGLDARKCEIGLDGAPTRAQVEHWEKHQIWPREGCRFCAGEGRFATGNAKVARRRLIERRSDGVEVRKIAPRGRVRKGAPMPVFIQPLDMDWI